MAIGKKAKNAKQTKAKSTTKSTATGKKEASKPSTAIAAAPIQHEPEIDLSSGPDAVAAHTARALAVEAASLRPLHGSARLMAHNSAIGAAAVLAQSERVTKELPTLDVANVAGIASLGVAVAWQAEEVARFHPSGDVDVRALTSEAARLRALLRTNLEGAITAGVLPSKTLDATIKTHGPFDIARDCIQYAKVFTTQAKKLAGKTPVTAAQVALAAKTGAQLRAALKPKGSKNAKASDLQAATDLRDRLLALLVKDYDQVRRAGGWLFGEARDEEVPILLAAAHAHPTKKRKGKVAAPGTGTAPTTSGKS